MSYNDADLVMNEKDVRRFYDLCEVDLVTGCWNWLGECRSKDGRGKFYLSSVDEKVLAHRTSYVTFVGPIPAGMELAHKFNEALQGFCRCAFWEHVRPLTHSQNMAEALGGTVELCPRGHDRRWGKSRSGGCNVCQWIRNRVNLGLQPCYNCGRVVHGCRCYEMKEWA